jgi:hypoxanthine-DNA glycosylase
MSERLIGFEPIIDKNVHTLILGTFPGIESLHLNSYYGNSKNHFWDVLYHCLDPTCPPHSLVRKNSREERYAFILKNGIGIWDIVQSCERIGNKDANIKNPIFNKLGALLQQRQLISKLLLNGRKVESYLKQSREIIPRTIVATVLNSTSTLNPNNTFFVLEEWKQHLQK